ncbi:MAG: hypothetical protein H8F28_18120 [Fibrella sp.]|nr:hypothetical protein [Armatimonadota bacterium]
MYRAVVPTLCCLIAAILPAAAQTRAATPKWELDVSAKSLPTNDLTGKLYNRPFRLERAEMDKHGLLLRMGAGFFPDSAIRIFLFKKGVAQNCEVRVPFSGEFGGNNPHIHLQYRANLESDDLPETKIYMNAYSMRLVLGKPRNGYVPGAIYLTLTDKSRSYLAGVFAAKIVP